MLTPSLCPRPNTATTPTTTTTTTTSTTTATPRCGHVCGHVRRAQPIAVLLRKGKIADDLVFLAGEDWKGKATPSVATEEYLAALEADSKEPLLVVTHHMLQYLAVLSGGQYLGQQVAKKLKRADKGHKAGDGVAMYSFQGLKAVQHPK